MDNSNELLDDLNESLEPQESIAEREVKDLFKLKAFLLVFFVIAVVLSFVGHYAVDFCWSLDEVESRFSILVVVLFAMVFIGINYLLMTKTIIEFFFWPCFVGAFRGIRSGILALDMLLLFVGGVVAGAVIFTFFAAFGILIEMERNAVLFGLKLNTVWCAFHATFLLLLGFSFGMMYLLAKDELYYDKDKLLENLNKPIDESLAEDLFKLKKNQLSFLAVGIALIAIRHYVDFYLICLREQHYVWIVIIYLLTLPLAPFFMLFIRRRIYAVSRIPISLNLAKYSSDFSAASLVVGFGILFCLTFFMLMLLEASAASTLEFKLKFDVGWWVMDATLLIILMIGFFYIQYHEKDTIIDHHDSEKKRLLKEAELAKK